MQNWFRSRKYRSGTRWCFWRWTDVDNEFILRLHILKTPWFAICLHWIRKPDPEPWLHDHPVSFLSIVLRGWYEEMRHPLQRWDTYEEWRAAKTRLRMRKWWNWIWASPDDQHTITDCAPHTLTLCFMGPKVREWGYHTPEGWVHWKQYSHQKYRGGLDGKRTESYLKESGNFEHSETSSPG